MSKEKVIDYKSASKKGQPMVTKVLRSSSRYLNWTVTIGPPVIKEETKKSEIDDRLISNVQIKEVYKVKKDYQLVLGGEGYVCLKEARDRLMTYLERENLIEKRKVNLDPMLGKLWGTKEQSTSLNKDELMKRVEEGLVLYHSLEAIDKKPEVRIGAFKGVVLTAEKSRNKNITKINGLELFGLDIQVMSNYLQIKFACSSTAHEVMGKNNSGKVILLFLFLGNCYLRQLFVRIVRIVGQ